MKGNVTQGSTQLTKWEMGSRTAAWSDTLQSFQGRQGKAVCRISWKQITAVAVITEAHG